MEGAVLFLFINTASRFALAPYIGALRAPYRTPGILGQRSLEVPYLRCDDDDDECSYPSLHALLSVCRQDHALSTRFVGLLVFQTAFLRLFWFCFG